MTKKNSLKRVFKKFFKSISRTPISLRPPSNRNIAHCTDTLYWIFSFVVNWRDFRVFFQRDDHFHDGRSDVQVPFRRAHGSTDQRHRQHGLSQLLPRMSVPRPTSHANDAESETFVNRLRDESLVFCKHDAVQYTVMYTVSCPYLWSCHINVHDDNITLYSIHEQHVIVTIEQ